MFYVDWSYIVLVLPAVLFALWAQNRVNSSFKKYSQKYVACGLTGQEAARRVLQDNGVLDVRIQMIQGDLTDNYDPKTNVINLSSNVYNSTSAAAIGVACHEAGHAVQHATGYTPIKIRTAMVPITNIGSALSMPLIMIGILMSYLGNEYAVIAYIGVALFSLTALFQLVTLPTEFNASRRAIHAIENYMSLSSDEVKGAKKVLSDAALTYVAALAVSVMQLLRLLLMVMRVSGRRDD